MIVPNESPNNVLTVAFWAGSERPITSYSKFVRSFHVVYTTVEDVIGLFWHRDCFIWSLLSKYTMPTVRASEKVLQTKYETWHECTSVLQHFSRLNPTTWSFFSMYEGEYKILYLVPSSHTDSLYRCCMDRGGTQKFSDRPAKIGQGSSLTGIYFQNLSISAVTSCRLLHWLLLHLWIWMRSGLTDQLAWIVFVSLHSIYDFAGLWHRMDVEITSVSWNVIETLLCSPIFSAR